MKRWGHGHSIATGALLGLLLAHHAAVLALVAFGGGVFAGRFWSFVDFWAGALREKVLHARRAPARPAATFTHYANGPSRANPGGDEVPY